MSTTVCNSKIGELENKIPDINGFLIQKLEKLRIKFLKFHSKYFTTPEVNKLSGTIFDPKLKQANLATNSGVNSIV